MFDPTKLGMFLVGFCVLLFNIITCNKRVATCYDIIIILTHIENAPI